VTVSPEILCMLLYSLLVTSQILLHYCAMFFILRIGDAPVGKHNTLTVVTHFSMSLQAEAEYQLRIQRQLEVEAHAIEQAQLQEITMREFERFNALSIEDTDNDNDGTLSINSAVSAATAAAMASMPSAASIYTSLQESLPRIDLDQFDMNSNNSDHQSKAYSPPIWEVFNFTRHWLWE
jgi:hypothetical protein